MAGSPAPPAGGLLTGLLANLRPFHKQFFGASTDQGARKAIRAQLESDALTAFSAIPTPLVIGDLFYATSTTAVGRLADVAVGRFLVSGGVGAAPAWSATPTLGVAGATKGTLAFAGNTSGTATVTPQAAAGTPTLTLPNTSGTFAVGVTNDTNVTLALSATTGMLTAGWTGTLAAARLNANVVQGVTNDTNVTGSIAAQVLTLGWTGILAASRGGTANGFTAFSGPATSTKTFTLPNASAAILTDNAAVTVAQGGTGIASGTSGGVPYYSGTSTIASSAALTANAIVLGGGAGAAPAALGSLGTTTTVLHGNASGAPTFGAVSLTADVTGALPVANGGTGDTGTAWPAYTPTVTATSGAFTTVSATGAYKQQGKEIRLRIIVTVTTIGTAAGRAIVTLPANTGVNCALSATYEGTFTSIADGGARGCVTAWDSVTAASVALTGVASGNRILISGIYEVP